MAKKMSKQKHMEKLEKIEKKHTRRKKTKFPHSILLRLSDEGWQFFQHLKQWGVSRSEYIRSSIKLTPRWKKYIAMHKAGYSLEDLKEFEEWKKQRDEAEKNPPNEHQPGEFDDEPSLPTTKGMPEGFGI